MTIQPELADTAAGKFSAAEVADAVLEGIERAVTARLEDPKHVLFAACMFRSGLSVFDAGDMRIFSTALQILRRRGVCRYSRRKRAWEFYIS